MAPRKNDIMLLEIAQVRIQEVYEISNTIQDHPGSIPIFKIQAKSLPEIYRNFNEALVKVLACCSETEESFYHEIRKEVDTSYFTTLSVLDSLQIPVSDQAETENTSYGNHTKLQPLSLQIFDGDFRKWQSFIDLFDCLVNKNRSLSNIERFSHLLTSLRGEPLQLVKAIPLSAENYVIAYKALCDRYNNPRLLATLHWQAIKGFPSLKSDDPKQLRALIDCFSENLAVLTNLDFPTESWNFILVGLLLDKLDPATRKRFELQTDTKRFPDFNNLKQFLIQQCTALETFSSTAPASYSSTISCSSAKLPTYKTSQIQYKPKLSSHIVSLEAGTTNASFNRNCPSCKGNHSLYNCQLFLSKNPTERFDIARQLRMCINCLRTDHSFKQCKSKSTCRNCGKPQHTLLHFEDRAASTHTAAVRSGTQQASAPPAIALSSTAMHDFGVTVLLSTAVVEVQDNSGNFQAIRVLLDPGSQASFIRESCVSKLMLPRQNSQVPIYGLGQTTPAVNRGATNCTIRSPLDTGKSIEITTFILSSISGNLPSVPVSNNWEHFNGLHFADPTWNIPGPIDILLGADVYPFIINGGVIQGKFLQPAAINTIFGWTIIGPMKGLQFDTVQAFFISLDNPIEQTLRRFWEIEELPVKSYASPDEEKADTIFEDTFVRDDTGRFTVSLPFNDIIPHFDDYFDIAKRRLFSLERKLSMQPDLRTQYKGFMQHYLESGHMTLLQTPPPGNNHYFIPHHAVFKDEGNISKIRVVFDASAKAKNKISLNDTQLAGPSLQSDISSVLLKFRTDPYVFICDVRQMFRQILIKEEHRNYQLILWRFSLNESIQTYQLNTVTYGVKSSPYLAIKTLQQLAILEGDRFPLAAEAIRSNLYVDDFTCSADSVESALATRDQLIELLQTAGFELRKWSSNCSSILEGIPIDFCQSKSFDFNSYESIKILGLQWLPNEDVFSFRVKPLRSACTKRNVLSEVARIYDPLGFLGPLTFFAKRLIQHFWMLGLDWDDTPPADICSQWQQYQEDLPSISLLKIPRCLAPTDPYTCELHAFCDSSEVGYAAVIYLKFHNLVNGEISVKLVMAKTRVAPIKRLSIPRLELCAAVLLSDLLLFVKQTYQGLIQIYDIFAWSDSTVALTWIRSPPFRWKTFVANRVSHIQEIIAPSRWFHIRSSDNQADRASRGLLPSAVLSCSLWWAGTEWLRQDSNYWPPQPTLSGSCTGADSEIKILTFVAQIESNIIDDLLARFSSLRKIQGIIAYIYRFKNSKTQRLTGPLTEMELHNALMVIVRHVQCACFSKELALIRLQSKLPKSFRKLSPFIDSDNVLRVGGRLRHSSLPYSAKFPALLPQRHRLTELIICSTHEKCYHPGISSTAYLVQQNFWVISIKVSIRKYLSSCYRCFRTNPSPVIPKMGDLPPARINQVKPFSCVGVDFAGPITIRASRLRGAKLLKSYICLFICFTTKAIHVELVSDLSSEAFLAALRRFIARRGRCSKLFSDCGTHFIGADRLLRSYLHCAATAEGIDWSFNPPSAPHFGGLWESGIKSIKVHLVRTIGDQILTFEELYTVLAQIESSLNSRPLCALSSDPNDLQCLTPGHFLTMEPLSAPPDEDLSQIKLPLRNGWKLLQKLHQDFWARWSHEYLHTLYQRAKWHDPNSSTPISKDALVLIKDDLLPPLRWKLGRVTNLFPGADGIVRVAEVMTSKGTFRRPMVKLCPLP